MSRKPARQPRPDGDNTRALIIDAAGELFGEHGYDGTTSKAICERAQVNLAAINYHFGGRDGLYRAVLHEVHQRLMSVQTLEALIHHPLPPAEKLRRFYHHITALLMDKDSWPLRLWAREADLYPRLGRTMEWDTAAGDAVLRAAGGKVVRFDDHNPLTYGKEGFANPFFIALAPGVLLQKG